MKKLSFVSIGMKVVCLGLLLFVFAHGCDRGGTSNGPPDGVCDDGTLLTCDMEEPVCEEYEVLAVQNNCYVCVNESTCLPWGTAECGEDAECELTEYCDPCGTSSCPDCRDCVPACIEHGCETESSVACDEIRPYCGEYATAIVENGCWVCVELDTCEPKEVQLCTSGLDCELGQWCNPCGTSSCPGCDDCVAICVEHSCETQSLEDLICDAIQPDCGEYRAAVIRDGCWICVDALTCETDVDMSCDDGTELLCDMEPPECGEHEILAVQDNCYVCVNPVSCAPWGEPGCDSDMDCGPKDYCYFCATSSCPMCDDCVAACIPHDCPTEDELMCYGVREDCGEGGVAVIQDGCWVCVYLDTCEPMNDLP